MGSKGILLFFLLLIFYSSLLSAFVMSSKYTGNLDHLIVLCHGLSGNHKELAYLERKLAEISDCVILNSKRNDGPLSKLGVDTCANELVSTFK